MKCGILHKLSMNSKKKSYSLFQNCSAVFMVLALLWLTISPAFVPVPPDSTKKGKIENGKPANAANEEESSKNPTTEEKVPGSNSFSEEYIHAHHETHYFFTLVSTFHKLENSDTYIAFHGELLVPPPNHA
jgi:hypothetical protein